MIAAHKSESPAATGLSAKLKTNNHIITLAEKKGNPAYLIAQLAKAGHTIAHGTNKDFFVGKWGLIRHCPDYAALIAFALMVGVSQ